MGARIRSSARAATARAMMIAMAGVAAGAITAFLVASPGLGRGVTAAEQTQRSRDCPGDILSLTADAPAPATVAALAEARDAYLGIDTSRARANLAARAASASARGRMVRRMCGRSVARRTVVVDLVFPEMLPSASLSQGTVFVSRFADGYHIWFVAH